MLYASLITVVVNPIVSLFVIGWLRRILRRSMLAVSGSATAPCRPQTHDMLDKLQPSTPGVDQPEAAVCAEPHAGSLTSRAVSQVRLAAAWYVAAGLTYALT